MKGKIRFIKGGITAPKGFAAGAAACGVKALPATRDDLCIVHSTLPTTAAGTFTTNRVKAAPVRVSQSYLRSAGSIQAIVANSGNANACTGPGGIEDARAMCKATAEALDINQRQVLVCSTGIIGERLPINRILSRIPVAADGLSDQSKGSAAAAAAIMTSDTCPKETAAEVTLSSGRKFRIGAIAKGAGMIDPNMATMLCFVTTDAAVSEAEIAAATSIAVEESFNRITIDGDMSTNDTVIVLANGGAENPRINSRSKDAKVFREALTQVMQRMAKKIVQDGERTTKFVEINVHGAKTHNDARKVAEAVANSSLVKCSWNGHDPNWGRVIHAVGYSGTAIREEMIDIYFGGLAACKNGLPTTTPIKELEAVVSKEEFTVCIDLNLGKSGYTIWTSDLSPEYVTFNREEYAARHRQLNKG